MIFFFFPQLAQLSQQCCFVISLFFSQLACLGFLVKFSISWGHEKENKKSQIRPKAGKKTWYIETICDAEIARNSVRDVFFVFWCFVPFFLKLNSFNTHTTMNKHSFFSSHSLSPVIDSLCFHNIYWTRNVKKSERRKLLMNQKFRECLNGYLFLRNRWVFWHLIEFLCWASFF